MKYMLLIYHEESAVDEEARERCYQKSVQLSHELHAHGQFLAAAPLQPVSTATSIRVRDSKLLVTDGPFAETRVQLGGYYLIEARDRDQAIDIARRNLRGAVGHHGNPSVS